MFGFLDVHVAQCEKLKLYIVLSGRQLLLVRDWFWVLKLKKICKDRDTALYVVISPNIQPELSKLTAKYKNALNKSTGKMENILAIIRVKNNSTTVF